MKLAPSARKDDPDGLVPLIDMVFILLLFFMIAGTLVPAPALPIRYVEGSGSAPPTVPANALYVTEDGRTFVAGRVVPLSGLKAALAASGGERTRLPVILDRGLPMHRMRSVLGALANAGLGEIELVTARGRAR